VCVAKAKKTQTTRRKVEMRDFLMKLYVKAQILREDHGQDLIEYALICALIALAATAGMTTVANAINAAFTSIGGKLNTYTS
jgi:pilus assembly protein Flp/PilA